ncbi:MAG TPA: alpha/beta hydrolase [Pseudomonadota bacterium]|nr:alpha/beta hydrolase [Pseudomonadota bacterium]
MTGFSVPVPGATLHVDSCAPAKKSPPHNPPLLLLHGGPGADSGYLRPQLDALADLGRGQTLYYYDQRGADRSPQNPGDPPPSAWVHRDDLESLRVYLGFSRVRLLGYSWGALLALLYASRFPERVEKLILLSPAPLSAKTRLAYEQNRAASLQRPSVAALRAELSARSATASPEEKRRFRFALAVTPYFVDPRRALDLSPFLVKQRLEEAVWNSLGKDFDFRKDLPTPAPFSTLVLHGEEDIIPIQSGEETARLLSAAFVRLPACGHVPYLEAPTLLFNALTPFLDDHRPDP